MHFGRTRGFPKGLMTRRKGRMPSVKPTTISFNKGSFSQNRELGQLTIDQKLSLRRNEKTVHNALISFQDIKSVISAISPKTKTTPWRSCISSDHSSASRPTVEIG
jgi:hypothetical protein